MNLKQHIGSIFFLVAATASAVYGAVSERGARRDGEGSEVNERRAFPNFDRAVLVGIELEREGSRLVLVRDKPSDPFRMTSPTAAATDASSVDQLIGALELATVFTRVPGKPDESSDASGSRVTGTLNLGTKKVHFVLHGRAPVPEGAAYLDVDQTGTVVVGRELASELARSFDAYRDRALVPISSSDVAHFEVRNASGTLSVDRLDEASFRFAATQPSAPSMRVTREVTDRWLSAVPELRAVTFASAADEASVTSATARPLSISIVTRGGQTFALRFGGPCPADPDDVIAILDAPLHVAACVPKVIAEAFDVSPAMAVDGRLFFARADESAEISLEAVGGPELSLARVGSGFRQRRPDARDLDSDDSDAASLLVGRVVSVTGAPVPALASGDAAHVVLRAAIARVGSEVTERIEVVTVGPNAYAKRLSDGGWLSLTPAALRALEPPPGGIHSESLLPHSFSPDGVTRLSIRCGAGPVASLVKESGAFVFESAPPSNVALAHLPVDGARVLELLELLGKTRARQVIRAEDVPASKDGCAVSVGFVGDGGASEASMTLRPAAAAPSTNGALAASSDVYAQLANQHDALLLSDALYRDVTEPLVDRGAIAWSGDLERGDSLRIVAKGKGVDPDEAKLKAALRELRASHVERLGPAAPDEFASTLLELRVSAEPNEGGPAAPAVTYRVARSKTPGELLVRRSDLEATFRLPDDALPLTR